MKLADVARYVSGNDPISFIPVMFKLWCVLASREWKFSQETGLFWYIQHDTVGVLLTGTTDRNGI
jgi:hypothetical protein